MKTKTGKYINCQTCGNKFYIPKWRFNIAKFCSPKCRGKSAFKQFQGICEICKKSFNYIACRKGKAKYCSRHCYYKAMHLKGTTEIICKFCKKVFRTSPSHHRIYCSIHCKNESFKKSKTGLFQCARKAFKARNLIIACNKCGYSKHPEILGIHHKDKDRNNNNLDNFIVLCPNCHSIEHKKHIPHP